MKKETSLCNKIVLSLDIGLTSIAWALQDMATKTIIDSGLLYFFDPKKTTNQERAAYSSARPATKEEEATHQTCTQTALSKENVSPACPRNESRAPLLGPQS
ncbi:MAG: hypothetical protein AAF335_01535 [Bacteroidota bacterium]